jgi:hypothetical protein
MQISCDGRLTIPPVAALNSIIVYRRESIMYRFSADSAQRSVREATVIDDSGYRPRLRHSLRG